MSAYFIGTGFILFASMSYNHYRKYKEDQLKDLYHSYPNKSEIFRQIHDKIAESWDSEMCEYEWAKRIDKYRKVVCSYAEGRVLEVGIGTGLNLEFYPLGISLTGVDWSENMLNICKKKAKGMVLTKMDAKHLDYPDNSFDTVIGVFTLSSSDEPEKIMSEMYRVCKEDGKILILDRGKTEDILNSISLNMFRYKYLFQYGYDQCANINRIVSSVPAKVVTYERKQGGTIYFYILTKEKQIK